MGIDYYNCSNCSTIFADCSDFGSCITCERMWCEECMSGIKSFIYDEQERCYLCFPTRPLEPSKRDLLNFALEKLKMPKKALKAELIAFDKRYREPQNVYHCTADKTQHDCKEGVCTTIALDWDIDNDDYEVNVQRGLCCAAKDKEDTQYWCVECQKSKKIKIAEV